MQPQTGFDPLFDLTIVLMAFLGGYGSIAGTVLGALIVEPVTLWLNTQPQFSGGYLSEILLGGVFLIVVLFMPRGIVPSGGEWITRLRSRGRPGGDPRDPHGGPPTGSVSATCHRLGRLGRCQVTALLRTDGIKKAYGGVQALNGASRSPSTRAPSPA